MKLARHDLCLLHKTAECVFPLSPPAQALFVRWRDAQFPFVVTRQERHASVDVGLPYYDSLTQQKVRYRYSVHQEAIRAIKPLPRLNEIFSTEKTVYSHVGVYGSYALQYLTGLFYVQPSSDLDVLIDYQSQTLDELRQMVEAMVAEQPITRLDGEVRFEGWGDCALSELLFASQSESMIFKTIDAVQLVPKEALYAAFPSLLCN